MVLIIGICFFVLRNLLLFGCSNVSTILYSMDHFLRLIFVLSRAQFCWKVYSLNDTLTFHFNICHWEECCLLIGLWQILDSETVINFVLKVGMELFTMKFQYKFKLYCFWKLEIWMKKDLNSLMTLIWPYRMDFYSEILKDDLILR